MDEEKLRLIDLSTEEVRHIISRMPTRFAVVISSIVVFLFVLFLVFGWVIRYPDIVTGKITINADAAPLKLIANSNGKLKLSGVKTMNPIKEGELIAFIDNAANPKTVFRIDSLLKSYNPGDTNIIGLNRHLPKNLSLGELNPKYYVFANALQEYANYELDRLYDKQGENFEELYKEQLMSIISADAKVKMARNSLDYTHKFYKRDSLLFTQGVISEAEMDKSQMNYISGKDALQNSITNLINAKQAAHQTKSKLQELAIQKPEKKQELRIALVSAYNDFLDNIKSWEQKYVFKAPMDGTVQFLKFYTEDQFIQSGEEVFTIVPKEDKAFGQVILPAHGSGKIKVGQEVIVKLDNFPYMEYGSITGRIRSISLTTSTVKTEKDQFDTYMALVDFPNQLKTNYGTELDFKAEAKGTAEIITNDRRLIERLFDNLKYVVKK